MSERLEEAVRKIKESHTFAVAFWREDRHEVLIEVQDEDSSGMLGQPMILRLDSSSPNREYSTVQWNPGGRS
jgi:hypothetical protein